MSMQLTLRCTTNGLVSRRKEGNMITATIKDNKLTITADLGGSMASMSGKTTIMASTGGFQAVLDFSYSLNVIKTKK